jgi:cell division protein FtsZ
MFEIQDAAKVITESVDPNARIIFGTVRDEKLKKGEVKITVIASNFPENFTKKTLFQASQINDKKEKEEVFSTKEPQPIKEDLETEDDEWGAVPAFLRRSKLK